jgi:hypothetical protein
LRAAGACSGAVDAAACDGICPSKAEHSTTTSALNYLWSTGRDERCTAGASAPGYLSIYKKNPLRAKLAFVAQSIFSGSFPMKIFKKKEMSNLPVCPKRLKLGGGICIA